MGRLRNDGSIQSANTPDSRFLSKNRVDRDYAIYRCMITKVNYIDDTGNTTFQNRQVTYTAAIIGGKKEGQEIQNIKSSNFYGGQHNFHERVWRQIEDNTKGIGTKPIAEQTGDIVFVAYVQGDTSAPVIIGGGTQPLDEDSTGATRADGHRMRSQYNGIFEEINKSGEWEFTRKGGSYNDSKDFFTPQDKQENPEEEALFEARLKFSKNKMLWEDPQSSILFEKAEKRWTHIVGSESEYKEVVDGKNEKVTRTFKSGLSIVEDGKGDKATITTKGGLTVEYDGSSDAITYTTSGGPSVTIDGSGVITLDANGTLVKIDGSSGKIELTGAAVDVGEAASALAALGPQLISWLSSHTHLYNPGPGSPAPSQPPTVPPPASLLSTSVKLKS